MTGLLRNSTFVLLVILTTSCQVQSNFCNYVKVQSEVDFIGEWLKFSEAEEHGILTKKECIENDIKFDNGNGNKKGIIRWADCLAGPDCNEAGMF